MADVHTPEQRSRNMAAIRCKDTRPEMIVRRLVHKFGFRFRLHRNDLPSKPDVVLPRLRKVILIHGCYWHMHGCRYGCVVPKTNADFWQAKRTSNVMRDRRNARALRKLGWKTLVVWECETRKPHAVARRLARFLEGDR